MQLLHAQAQIQDQIAQLQRLGAADLLAAAEGQSHVLATVQQRLASGAVGVADLRAEVTAAVANLAATTTLIQGAAAARHAETERTLREASAQARQTVEGFMQAYYEDRIFDPYLRFASVEEERAYREREAERARAIEAELAKGTPEGDRHALALMRKQLEDAGQHGADQSPDYDQWMRKAYEGEAVLAAAQSAEPQPDQSASMPDPLDNIAPDTTVDPAIAAAFQSAGVTLTPATTTGHGVFQACGDAKSGWEVC